MFRGKENGDCWPADPLHRPALRSLVPGANSDRLLIYCNGQGRLVPE